MTVVIVGGVTAWSVAQTTIVDAPRFQHRGYLIDTSRHYLPLTVLLQQIDALAYNKFNVLHWHIVDDQSFPFVSDKWPLLSKMGAYDTRHVYSKAQVQQVISYARMRGVRVIAEFDTPGHTQSWGLGYPQLLTPCYTGSQPNGQRYAMYPISNYTYEFMASFLSEVRKVFPDAYLHIGGDEVCLCVAHLRRIA
jgi:hexosaminidase